MKPLFDLTRFEDRAFSAGDVARFASYYTGDGAGELQLTTSMVTTAVHRFAPRDPSDREGAKRFGFLLPAKGWRARQKHTYSLRQVLAFAVFDQLRVSGWPQHLALFDANRVYTLPGDFVKKFNEQRKGLALMRIGLLGSPHSLRKKGAGVICYAKYEELEDEVGKWLDAKTRVYTTDPTYASAVYRPEEHKPTYRVCIVSAALKQCCQRLTV